jgi:hypothetical protein
MDVRAASKSDVANHLLATGDVRRLLLKYAVPSIIAMVVGALYNMVDQIFIGWGVGMLGNAATNVAFPMMTFSMASECIKNLACTGRGSKVSSAVLRISPPFRDDSGAFGVRCLGEYPVPERELRGAGFFRSDCDALALCGR